MNLKFNYVYYILNTIRLGSGFYTNIVQETHHMHSNYLEVGLEANWICIAMEPIGGT